MSKVRLTKEEATVAAEGKRAVQVMASLREVNDDARGTIVTMDASSSAKDRDLEHISVSGWKIPATLPKLQFGHRYHEPELTIGRLIDVKKDVTRDRLVIVAEMADKVAGHEKAALVADMLRRGFLDQGSVGFIPEAWKDADGSEHSLEKDGWPWPSANRTYTSQELLEFSIVPVPSQRDSLLLALRAVGGEAWETLLEQLAEAAREAKRPRDPAAPAPAYEPTLLKLGIKKLIAAPDPDAEAARLRRELADLRERYEALTKSA